MIVLLVLLTERITPPFPSLTFSLLVFMDDDWVDAREKRP